MLPNLALLWPTFALVALVFAVWLAMFVERNAHMRRTPPAADAFASSDSKRAYFADADTGAANLANLFELPVLFFALVPLLLVTRQADHVQVLLAWAFVSLRVAHSIVHLARAKVSIRFLAYLLSCIVLLAMWIGFFVDVVHAQSVISAMPVTG